MTPRMRNENARFVEVPGYPDLELNRASGIYYVRKHVAGKGEFFKSTRQKTKRMAQTVADEMLREFIGRKPGLRNERIRIAKACDLLLEQCEEETQLKDEDGHVLRRAVTFEKDCFYIPKIKELFGEYWADEIDEQFWKSWVKRVGRKLGIKLGDYAKYLSKVLTYAFEESYLGRKPRIKNPDKDPKKAGDYTEEQTTLFVRAAEEKLKHQVVLGAENPLRPNEIDAMQFAYLKFTTDRETGEEITIYSLPETFTKTWEARDMVLSSNSNRILRERYKNRDKTSPYVFPAPKDPSRPQSRQHRARMWGRMKARARQMAMEEGIEYPSGKIKFHWLRHNFYRTALLEMGLPIAQVSQVGGTSAATLQRKYLASRPEKTRQVTQAVRLKLDGGGGEEE